MRSEIHAHISDLETKLMAAELAAHDHALDTKFEWMHTRLRAAKTASDELLAKGRDVARAMVDVERSFGVDLENILFVLNRENGTP